MMASERSMISRRFSTPSPVSILAMIMTSSRDNASRTESTSDPDRTNETARISNSSSRSASSRRRSSSVGNRSLMIDEGSDRPGLPITAPPEVTRAMTWFLQRTISSETPPSPMWIRSPGWSCERTSLRSTVMRWTLEASPRASTSSISSPTLKVTSDVPKEPARILGPGMSTMMARSGAMTRTRRNSSTPEAMSPWANEMRKTSTPARTSSRNISSEFDAGPIVATIRVRRTGFPSCLWSSLRGGQQRLG